MILMSKQEIARLHEKHEQWLKDQVRESCLKVKNGTSVFICNDEANSIVRKHFEESTKSNGFTGG